MKIGLGNHKLSGYAKVNNSEIIDWLFGYFKFDRSRSIYNFHNSVSIRLLKQRSPVNNTRIYGFNSSKLCPFFKIRETPEKELLLNFIPSFCKNLIFKSSTNLDRLIIASGNLEKMNSINLSCCVVSLNLVNFLMQKCIQLKRFGVRGEIFTRLNNKDFKKENLEEEVRLNSPKALSLNVFSKMRKLESLCFVNTNVGDNLFSVLVHKNDNLKRLIIYNNNKLTSKSYKSLKDLRLNYLFLYGCNVFDEDFKSICLIDTLKKIDICKTKCTINSLSIMSKCTSLTKFRYSYNHLNNISNVCDAKFKDLKKNKFLRVISLYNVEDISLNNFEILGEMNHLEQIDLTNCNIDNEMLRVFLKNTRVSSLGIESNPKLLNMEAIKLLVKKKSLREIRFIQNRYDKECNTYLLENCEYLTSLTTNIDFMVKENLVCFKKNKKLSTLKIGRASCRERV